MPQGCRWPLTYRRLTCGSLHSTTATPLQGPECFNLEKPTLEEFDRRVAGQYAPGVQRWPLTCRRLTCGVATPPQPPDATQAGEQNGVACGRMPRVATLAIDMSEAHLWCRRAPTKPPLFRGRNVSTLRSPLWTNSIVGWLGQNAPGVQRWPLTCRRLTCGVAGLHHSHPMPLKPENKTGWLGQNAPGVQRWPLTCRRLTCGVAALHHSHPMPLKPENKTGWLGQYAPGVQRWPLTCRRLTCGVAGLHHSHPMSLKPENQSGWLGQNAPGVQRWPLTCRTLTCGVAALHHSHPMPLKPENKTGWLGQNAPGVPLAFDLSDAHLWCRCAPPQPPVANANLESLENRNGVAGAECPRGATLAFDLSDAHLWCRSGLTHHFFLRF